MIPKAANYSAALDPHWDRSVGRPQYLAAGTDNDPTLQVVDQ